MAHGGPRSGAGRKPGAATKLNQQAREEALSEGISPLDYMLTVLRDTTQSQEDRMDAAKASAPYLHARLAAVEHSGGIALSHEAALSELDGPEGEEDQASAER